VELEVAAVEGGTEPVAPVVGSDDDADDAELADAVAGTEGLV
jgi:hypothetical protein